nr:hypothetical protein [Bacillus thuringiensis]
MDCLFKKDDLAMIVHHDGVLEVVKRAEKSKLSKGRLKKIEFVILSFSYIQLLQRI